MTKTILHSLNRSIPAKRVTTQESNATDAATITVQSDALASLVVALFDRETELHRLLRSYEFTREFLAAAANQESTGASHLDRTLSKFITRAEELANQASLYMAEHCDLRQCSTEMPALVAEALNRGLRIQDALGSYKFARKGLLDMAKEDGVSRENLAFFIAVFVRESDALANQVKLQLGKA